MATNEKVSAPAPSDALLRAETGENHAQVSPLSQDATGPSPSAELNSTAIQSAPPAYSNTESYAAHEKSAPLPDAPQPVRLVTPLTALGRDEATVDCPRCRTAVQTRIEKHAGERATVASLIICLCVGCLCAWIPCVMDDCKDTEHYCRTCNLPLATVSAGGAVTLSKAVRDAAATGSQFYAGPVQNRVDRMPPLPVQSQFAAPQQEQQQGYVARQESMQEQENGRVQENGQVVMPPVEMR
ncbi:hypothetical protein ANO11243_075380 [Dothideomycetidae sp. 11243]|nr:hypothetical protein ANO11243_075380 [fungal sp. No.11243]